MSTTITLRSEEEIVCLRALFAGRLEAVRDYLYRPLPAYSTATSVWDEERELNKRAKLTRELHWLRLAVDHGTNYPDEMLETMLPSHDGVSVSIAENGLEDTDFNVRRDSFLLPWLLGLPVSGYVKYEFEAIA